MVKCQLQCMSGRIFVVDIEVLGKATVIKAMLDDLGIGRDPNVEVDEDVIPLPNLTEKCMEKLIEWCTQHKDDPPFPENEEFNFKDEIGEWDLEFLRMDDSTLFDLILAANYLDIKGLLDITTTYVARIITELRTPEEIRKRFNIKNDLTPEDLEQIKKEAEHWLEDDDDEEMSPAAAPEPQPSTSRVGESVFQGMPDLEDPMPMSPEGAEGGSVEGAVGGDEELGAVGGEPAEEELGAVGGAPKNSSSECLRARSKRPNTSSQSDCITSNSKLILSSSTELQINMANSE